MLKGFISHLRQSQIKATAKATIMPGGAWLLLRYCSIANYHRQPSYLAPAPHACQWSNSDTTLVHVYTATACITTVLCEYKPVTTSLQLKCCMHSLRLRPRAACVVSAPVHYISYSPRRGVLINSDCSIFYIAQPDNHRNSILKDTSHKLNVVCSFTQ